MNVHYIKSSLLKDRKVVIMAKLIWKLWVSFSILFVLVNIACWCCILCRHGTVFTTGFTSHLTILKKRRKPSSECELILQNFQLPLLISLDRNNILLYLWMLNKKKGAFSLMMVYRTSSWCSWLILSLLSRLTKKLFSLCCINIRRGLDLT